jgi:hypothetical protein
LELGWERFRFCGSIAWIVDALVYRPRFPTDPMVDEVEKAADETAISAVGRNFDVGISNKSRFYEAHVLEIVKFGC